MTRTGDQLLQGFSEFIDDWFASTTTSAGNAGGTTLVDNALKGFGDNRLQGGFIRQTLTPFAVRRVSGNTQSSGTATVQQAFAAQVGSSVAYEFHKYEPSKKFLALDKARLAVIDHVFQIKLNDTITSDGITTTYDIPSNIEQGPIVAYIEQPIETANITWNFLGDPLGDSTSKWTASSVTASTVSRNFNDPLIPKYDETCTKLVVAASTNGTYTQVVADMANSMTAALAADRKMTFAAWIYCTEASKVRLRLLDDNGTLATGNYHGGNGWELLWVEGTVAGNNATTLSCRMLLDSTANPATVYFNRGWFYFGGKEKVTDSIYSEERKVDVRRDATEQHIILSSRVPRGYQLRLAGRAPLTAIGTTISTQAAATMEVDEKSEQILYAYAAELLFAWEGIKTDHLPDVIARINNARARLPDLQRAWEYNSPAPVLRSPWAR